MWFACLTLADGARTQRSTGVRDVGKPKERANQRRQALAIAQEFEETAQGNRAESQIRKTMVDLFQRVNAKRMEFAKADAFLQNWLVRVKTRKGESTHTRYAGVTDDFLVHLGPKAKGMLSDVGPADVQTYLDAQLVAGKKAKTCRNEAKILNIPFSLALRQGLILANPVAAAEIPDDEGESKAPFDGQQIKSLFAAATGDWKTLIALGTYLGLRLGDGALFTWQNIDFERKVVRYRPQKTRRHKKEVVCPIHPDLEAYLLHLPTSDDPNAPLAPSAFGHYTGGHTGLSAKFQEVIAAAGIDNTPIASGSGKKGRAFRKFGFHSFRHSFKSVLVNVGVEVETVDVLIGHAKKTVSETYIHRKLPLLRRAIARIPNYRLTSAHA